MKNYLSIILLSFFIPLLSFSQSLELIDPEEVVSGTPQNDLLVLNFDVMNTSNIAVDIKVIRNVISEVQGTANYFCWELCYGPGTDLSPTALTIQPGQTVSNFYADYLPNGYQGVTTIEYCFFNVNDPSDEICHTVEFNVSSTTAVDEQEAISLGNARPNPATGNTMIPFKMKGSNQSATLVVYNLVGQEVLNIPVNGMEGVINLDVNSLQSGIYLYTLLNNNAVLSSKKLIVRN